MVCFYLALSLPRAETHGGTRLLGVRCLGMWWEAAEPRRLPRIFHETW